MEELEAQETVVFVCHSEEYGVPIEEGSVNLGAVAKHFGVSTSALAAQTTKGRRALLCDDHGMSTISTWKDGQTVKLVLRGT